MLHAVISDVHGNRWALEAVLHDIASRRVDAILNLGDSVYGPLQPHETSSLLREHCAIHVLGNQDRILFETSAHPGNATLQGCLDRMSDDDLRWLQSTHVPSVTVDGLLLVHGTLHNDSVYLLENVSRGVPSIVHGDFIMKELADAQSSIVLCGHSHTPRCVRVYDRYLINPGSVGLQAYDDDFPCPHRMETGSPDARYALLETEAGKLVRVEHITVAYDYREAVAHARRNGRDDWAKWLASGRA